MIEGTNEINQEYIREQLLVIREYKINSNRAKAIKARLKKFNQFIDEEFLHPRLLPDELIVDPIVWQSSQKVINPRLITKILNSNQTVNVVESGLINKILKGECQMYIDLPPISIYDYLTRLRKFGLRLVTSYVCNLHTYT